MTLDNPKDIDVARDVEIVVLRENMPLFLNAAYFKNALEEAISSRCFTVCHYHLEEGEDKLGLISLLEGWQERMLITTYQFYRR